MITMVPSQYSEVIASYQIPEISKSTGHVELWTSNLETWEY